MAIGVKADLCAGTIDTIVTGGPNRIVQVRRVRKDGWTNARRNGFLLALSMTANARASAAGVGMSISGAIQLKRRDPAFAALWAEALAMCYDRLEEALLAAAMAGLTNDGSSDRTGAVAVSEDLHDAGHDDENEADHDRGERRVAAGDEVCGDVRHSVCHGKESDAPSAATSVLSGMGSSRGSGGGPGLGLGNGLGGGLAPDAGSGVFRLTGIEAVQVGLSMLTRYRAAQTRSGRKAKHRRATTAQTNASIAKKLDSLARRLRDATAGRGE